MTNKTFIPAFKAKVGDWEYYICIMKYAEVARQIGFAYEYGGNRDLSEMIQRGISSRTEDIKKYILQSEHRFLGSLIVAAWGGTPTYLPVAMDDPDGMLSGIDRNFGVLTFDGTQQYFALDGQHRLRAIKEAIATNRELGSEDICVIMVAHFDTEKVKLRTRRLFTNINRNAKATTGAENIVLDEDDGPAILTRRLLTDHPFLKQDGVVKVFTRNGEDGDLKVAGGNIAQTDKKAFTTIINLYEVVRYMCFDLHPSMQSQSARPSDEVLEESYSIIVQRLDDLIAKAGDIRSKFENGIPPRDLRSPKGREGEGHPFMRPVNQKSVARVLRQIAEQKLLSWPIILDRLSALPWKIAEGPWLAVFNPANNKIITTKENVKLLDDLLYVHIAASSKQSIVKVRKQFKDIRGVSYPMSEAQLQENLTPHTENRIVIPDIVPPETLPTDSEAEVADMPESSGE